jgi:hypothetical protein
MEFSVKERSSPDIVTVRESVVNVATHVFVDPFTVDTVVVAPEVTISNRPDVVVDWIRASAEALEPEARVAGVGSMRSDEQAERRTAVRARRRIRVFMVDRMMSG